VKDRESREQRDQIFRQKVGSAFELSSRFDAFEVLEARVYLGKKLKSMENRSLSKAQFYKTITDDPKAHIMVKKLLGMAEDVSIAIRYDYADEQVLNRSLGYIICNIYSQFLPYIQQERKKTANDDLYNELEAIYNAWGKGKSIVTGKSFPTWVPSSK